MHWIDPDSLPETRGSVARFLYNAHGDADGFLLDGNRQVHVPPHLSAELLRKVKLGDDVRIRGVKPRGADLVAAVSVSTSHGTAILDHGPQSNHRHSPQLRTAKKIELRGRVQTTLYAPKGEVCGAVLDGGEIIRMSPKENIALAPFFAIGNDISVWGDAITVKGQRIVDIADVALQS